jgi:hypothetical protein
MFQPRSDALDIGIDAVKIPCRNGTSFGEDGIVRFELPRSLGFAQLSNAYLEMEVDLTNPNNTPAQNAAQPPMMLERQQGASCLINRCSIRSSGRLIEQLEGYNVFNNLAYNATNTNGTMNKRSRLEGCAPSYQIIDNPYCTTNKVISPITNAQYQIATPWVAGALNNANVCWKPVRRKVCLPLNTGIFNSPNAFGLAMMPLEVELILEKSLRAMRICNYGDASISLVGTSVAGAGYELRTVAINDRSRFNGIGGALPVPRASVNNAVAGEQNINQLNNFPFRVGQIVRLDGADAQGGGGVYPIQSIAVGENGGAAPGSILLKFAVDVTAGAGGVVNVHSLAANGGPLNGHGAFGYRVHNPRLVVPKVIPPPETVNKMYEAMSRGAVSQDIVTYTLYDNAIPATQTTSTNIISAELTRAKAILSCPISQSNLDNVNNSNAFCSQYLDANEYYFQLNNKLAPDRNVQLAREINPNVALITNVSDNVRSPFQLGTRPEGFHVFEIEKALRSGDIRLKDLRFLTQNASLNRGFTATEPGAWCVGRSLSANSGTSMNMVGKTCILYLNYRPTSNMVKLLRNFVVHVRTIQFGQDGVQVFY